MNGHGMNKKKRTVKTKKYNKHKKTIITELNLVCKTLDCYEE